MRALASILLTLAGISAGIQVLPAFSQEREIGPKCTPWNQHRVLFKRGGHSLTADSAATLLAFIKEAGRDCGYRLYATASKEGGFKTAFSLAGRRLSSTEAFLKENGVAPEMVLPLSHWVDDAAKDVKEARSAIIYTLPKQGVSCRKTEQRQPVEVQLWFEEKSYVISTQRKEDLENFAKSILSSRCNVEITAFAVSEYKGRKAEEKNKELAKQRAKGVRDILISAGIDADRLVNTAVKNAPVNTPNTASNRRAVAALM
jgi:outer membrane protein OmpA-like peptidoglycan-associated protein